MKINKVAGFIGTLMVTAGCHTNPSKPFINPCDRALEHASQYMTKSEIAKMKEHALMQITDYTQNVSDKIFYWDSTLTSKKAEEAFYQGQKFARDSLDGIIYPRRTFQLPIDTVIKKPRHGQEIADSSHIGLAEYIGGEEMYELVQKEPKKLLPAEQNNSHRNRINHITHYYGVVGSVAAERYAYNKGIESVINKQHK